MTFMWIWLHAKLWTPLYRSTEFVALWSAQRETQPQASFQIWDINLFLRYCSNKNLSGTHGQMHGKPHDIMRPVLCYVQKVEHPTPPPPHIFLAEHFYFWDILRPPYVQCMCKRHAQIGIRKVPCWWLFHSSCLYKQCTKVPPLLCHLNLVHTNDNPNESIKAQEWKNRKLVYLIWTLFQDNKGTKYFLGVGQYSNLLRQCLW